VKPELAQSHPVASAKSQWKLIGGMAWRWMVAGLAGSIFDLPILSFILGFVLMLQWLWAIRSTDFHVHYAAKMGIVRANVVRTMLLVFCVLGFVGSQGEPHEPYFIAWSGYVLALFVQTFFSIKYLSPQDPE
jgi:hypothetical protein